MTKQKYNDFWIHPIKFLCQLLYHCLILCIFATDSVSPSVGKWVLTYCKRTLRVVIFYLQISQINDQKKRNRKRLRWEYYTLVSELIHEAGMCNTIRRGLTRVAFPEQGNARARTWDKRECRAPHVFLYQT